jgi:uncharacterized protein YdiU (UPF0061 family)
VQLTAFGVSRRRFSSDFVPNTSDHGGRYRWKNQPGIGQWNVAALVSVFTPFASHEDLQHIVNDFQQAYDGYYRQEMCHKLGFNVKVICGNADFVKKFDDLVGRLCCGPWPFIVYFALVCYRSVGFSGHFMLGYA